jgi:peptidoglycan/LPS O-acetylase OafA/YrhL
MTKQESMMMKGVAILIMLFGHLFCHEHVVATACINLCSVRGVPLVAWLSRAAHPVDYYLFLGGLGLAISNRGGEDSNRYKRVVKLFIIYWLSLLIFVTIGHFINSVRYPGSITTIIANATAFDTSYNGEMWFLFPYVILSLLAPILFRLFDRYKTRYVLATMYFMHLCTSFVISRYGAQYLYPNRWIYNPLLVFHFMFMFMLGAACARHNYFEKLKKYSRKHRLLPKVSYILLALIFVLWSSIKIRFTATFLTLAIISLIIIAPKPQFVIKSLSYLGKYSTGMWMVHTYFCYYLFSDFIYSVKYPLLIYALLIAVSLFSAVIIQKSSAKVCSMLSI